MNFIYMHACYLSGKSLIQYVAAFIKLKVCKNTYMWNCRCTYIHTSIYVHTCIDKFGINIMSITQPILTNVCICLYVCLWTHRYIYIIPSIYISQLMHIHMYTYIYLYIYPFPYGYTYTYMYKCFFFIHMVLYVPSYRHTYMYIYLKKYF